MSVRYFQDGEGYLYEVPSDMNYYDGTAQVLTKEGWVTTEWSGAFQDLCYEIRMGAINFAV